MRVEERRVGKGARSVGPRGRNRVRHSPSKTGVNALVAHAAMASQAILPTYDFGSNRAANSVCSLSRRERGEESRSLYFCSSLIPTLSPNVKGSASRSLRFRRHAS